jgi:hypothetical protein
VNLFELADTLPSGLHDALVRRLELDFETRTATLYASICIGDPDAAINQERELRRDVMVVIDGLLFCHIEPPDPRRTFAAGESVMIDLCNPDEAHPLSEHVRAEAFFARLFVHDWNAFVHIAASSARLAGTSG